MNKILDIGLRFGFFSFIFFLVASHSVYAHEDSEQHIGPETWKTTFIISCGILGIALLGIFIEKLGLSRTSEQLLKGIVIIGALIALGSYIWHYRIH